MDDGFDPIRLPKASWTPGNKEELKYAAMVQVVILMLSWGRAADADGIPLTEQDVIDVLQNACRNYGPNKDDLDAGPKGAGDE